jgi:hypothetical protein
MIKIERVEADYVSCNCCHKRDINNIHIRFCGKYGQGTIITLCEECAKDLRKLLTERYGEPEITHEQAIDYLHKTGWLQNHDRILTEHEEMYKRAFSVACELLIGASLFGTTEETMFAEIMDKEGIVSSHSYEKYILDNLARLTGEDDGTD